MLPFFRLIKFYILIRNTILRCSFCYSINLILIFDFIGNIKPDENPTHYRSPRQYIDMCQSRILSGTSEQPHEQVYELVFAKALESYYEIKNNNNQVK